ncbi:MAG: dihydropteroate synthase [Lentisphaerota bacterium]
MNKGKDKLIWKCRGRDLELGPRTLIMGIVNVTPDSFSDGGRFFEREAAVDHARAMVEEGADILDLGGESTRPGAAEVTEAEEIRRVVSVVESLAGRVDCLLSVDTTKSGVARRALEAGAHIINDVSALTADPDMAEVAAATGAGVVLMHRQGTPRTMQQNPVYGHVVTEVQTYLLQRMESLMQQGLPAERMALDPGIGFGKTLEHNLELLRNLDALSSLGRPLLIGVSRKSFLGKITGREVQDRLAATLAAQAFAVLKGAHILRVHDVKESCDMARILDTLRLEESRDADD